MICGALPLYRKYRIIINPFLFLIFSKVHIIVSLSFQGKAKKKSKKAQIMAVRDDDFANDYGDDLGGEYDDFI